MKSKGLVSSDGSDILGQDIPEEGPKQTVLKEISNDNLNLKEGYSVIKITPRRNPKQIINPMTRQLEPERLFPCDYEMLVILTKDKELAGEVFIRAGAELSPVVIKDGRIVEAVIKNEDILGSVEVR